VQEVSEVVPKAIVQARSTWNDELHRTIRKIRKIRKIRIPLGFVALLMVAPQDDKTGGALWYVDPGQP
jgi:hypothetical protein